jgi:hypothetical protein
LQQVLASWVLTAAAGLAGCAGYRLGTTLPPDVRSVHVPTFVNRTGEPLVEAETTRATVQELQRDGTLKVRSADEADVVLAATVVDFYLEPLRYEKDASRTVREYRLRLTADIVLKSRRTGDELFAGRVQGESTFEPGGDLSSAKRQALPAAARDLAHDIVESIVEFW